MHLSASQTRSLREVMRLLAEAAEGDALREALALPMLDLLRADNYCSMVWNAALDRFERPTWVNMTEDNLRAWDAHYRFVDPITRPLMERRAPTVATQVIGQRELMRTEFFNDFLQRDRMHWGINVYFFDSDDCIGDFRIWRQRSRGNFDGQDVELLRLLEPAVGGALARLRWQQRAAAVTLGSEPPGERLQRLAGLSPREAEVAWLVGSGCPDKLIARRLGVGHPTVRFHLGNAFRKLHADNRAALASRVQALLGTPRVDGDGQPPGD